MITRKVWTALTVAVLLAIAGCGTGAFEKLGDAADHCVFEWGTEGRLQLGLQCD